MSLAKLNFLAHAASSVSARPILTSGKNILSSSVCKERVTTNMEQSNIVSSISMLPSQDKSYEENENGDYGSISMISSSSGKIRYTESKGSLLPLSHTNVQNKIQNTNMIQVSDNDQYHVVLKSDSDSPSNSFLSESPNYSQLNQKHSLEQPDMRQISPSSCDVYSAQKNSTDHAEQLIKGSSGNHDVNHAAENSRTCLHGKCSSDAQGASKLRTNNDSSINQRGTIGQRSIGSSFFPLQLHIALGFPPAVDQHGEDIDCKDRKMALEWLPHGRSWRILRFEALQRILHEYFPQCGGSIDVFLHNVGLWGFQQVHDHGSDHGSYYHQNFAREDPYLCQSMSRPIPSYIPTRVSSLEHRRQIRTEKSDKSKPTGPSGQTICGVKIQPQESYLRSFDSQCGNSQRIIPSASSDESSFPSREKSTFKTEDASSKAHLYLSSSDVNGEQILRSSSSSKLGFSSSLLSGCGSQSSDATKASAIIEDWTGEVCSDKVPLRGPRHSIFRKKYELETMEQQRSCNMSSHAAPVFSSSRRGRRNYGVGRNFVQPKNSNGEFSSVPSGEQNGELDIILGKSPCTSSVGLKRERLDHDVPDSEPKSKKLLQTVEERGDKNPTSRCRSSDETCNAESSSARWRTTSATEQNHHEQGSSLSYDTVVPALPPFAFKHKTINVQGSDVTGEHHVESRNQSYSGSVRSSRGGCRSRSSSMCRRDLSGIQVSQLSGGECETVIRHKPTFGVSRRGGLNRRISLHHQSSKSCVTSNIYSNDKVREEARNVSSSPVDCKEEKRQILTDDHPVLFSTHHGLPIAVAISRKGMHQRRSSVASAPVIKVSVADPQASC